MEKEAQIYIKFCLKERKGVYLLLYTHFTEFMYSRISSNVTRGFFAVRGQ